MKKMIVSLMLISFIILLSGCTKFISLLQNTTFTRQQETDSTFVIGTRGPTDDDEITRGVFSKLIDALSKDDAESIYQLFSPATRNSVADLTVLAERLCVEFDGDYVSYEMFGPDVSARKENGNKVEEMHASFVVTTTVGKYYFVLHFCTTNTDAPEQIGIYSLCFSKEGTGNDFTFWGDTNWTPGIVFWDDIPETEEHDAAQGDKGTVLLSPLENPSDSHPTNPK